MSGCCLNHQPPNAGLPLEARRFRALKSRGQRRYLGTSRSSGHASAWYWSNNHRADRSIAIGGLAPTTRRISLFLAPHRRGETRRGWMALGRPAHTIQQRPAAKSWTTLQLLWINSALVAGAHLPAVKADLGATLEWTGISVAKRS